MKCGVILYGPPAAGKDTITECLRSIRPAYTLFPRLKAGSGRASGYRMTTDAELEALRAKGDMVWENRRYGATYAIDRPTLERLLDTRWPIVHLGQLKAIERIVEAVPDVKWISVYVWCPRNVAEERIAARCTGDDAARLQAWDETEPLENADLVFNTADIAPGRAAYEIDRLVGRS